MFIDSHCHLEMEHFDKDREQVIKRCLEQGFTYILTVGTEEKYFERVIEILNEYPEVYGAIGIHPHNSNELNIGLARRIEGYLTHKKIIAYGEIGLDFFKNYSPRDIQIKVFEEQIQSAKKACLPIIVHSRNAKEETLQILKETDACSSGGVIHCYSYDLDTAKRLLDMGFYISIPGTITYNNTETLRTAVQYIPIDRILVETDAPFLTPHPFRGKRNEPAFAKYTVEKIATIKAIDIEDMTSYIYDNFKKLFLTNLKGDKK
jgi:TatD DNase family protein